MIDTIAPVILAGGTGSRLWPLSRDLHPKQLLPLVSDLTMLQATILRAQKIANVKNPLIVCNQNYHFLVANQLHDIHVKNTAIILEPEGKNTAPATTIAALYFIQQNEDPLLLVMPADHHIEETDNFIKSIAIAARHAKEGKLVLFGVTPNRAETGYGYIKTTGTDHSGAFTVERFVEKPDLATANAYLNSGEYYWNSGIFLFRASQFLNEMQQHSPDILHACQKAIRHLHHDLDFIRLDKTDYAACPNDSIDYAVMEKTQNAVVVPLDAAWDDVGSWSALWATQTSDHNGNVIRGDIITDSVNNSYLHAQSRMLAVVGVQDHVVIETADAVLVAHKDHCQSIKQLVTTLKQQKRPETISHKKVYRPWGHYEILNSGPTFQVKRLTLKPGANISLQLHHHRSEHWVIVSGTAEVRCDDKTFLLSSNESTYIPCGIKHRLKNAGTMPLEVIEVQTGDYLGEDDIVRFETADESNNAVIA